MPQSLMPELQTWYQQGHFRTCRSHQIFYGMQGAGPNLVLIHGFPTSAWDWHKVIPALAEEHRVIYLDLPGFGLSDKPREDYPIIEQADRVIDLLQHLGVFDAHILAHDYGATVAQELLARREEDTSPIRWHSCTILNAGLFPEAHRPLRIQTLLASPLGPFIAPMIGKDTFQRSMASIWGEAPVAIEELEAMWQLLQWDDGKSTIPYLIKYMEQRVTNRERWVGALMQTEVPLLLIDGLADPISGQSLVDRFTELCPQGKIVALEGVGHYPQLEAPEAVIDAWRAFEAELPALIPGEPVP